MRRLRGDLPLLLLGACPRGLARQLAWTEEASGALLPTGGLGALAIGGWLLRQAGMSTRRIVESSSALFFLTSGMNVAALTVGGVMLASDAFGGHDTLVLAACPDRAGSGVDCVTLALPVVRAAAHRTAAGPGGWSTYRPASKRPAIRWCAPNWRMLGAIGYLGFDIAALGAPVRGRRSPDPDRRARARLHHRLHGQPAPRTRGLRRAGGRPGRHADRLRRSRAPRPPPRSSSTTRSRSGSPASAA